jgi:hypothetical protein
MKKIILPFLFVATLLMGFKLAMTDEEKVGLGKVQKVNGIEVYIMCEPLRPYDIVEDVSVYDAGVSQNYVDDWVNKYVKKAKKLIEDGKPVDAIVYTNGKKASAVKFK